MPAYFYIQLYKSSEEIKVPNLINNTMDGIITSGCKYKITQIHTCNNPQEIWEKQSFNTKKKLMNLNETKELLIRDLKEWINDRMKKRWLPGIDVVFEVDFEFDVTLLAKKEIPDEARELKLCFWYNPKNDLIIIDIDTWEEYVLMYGKDSTHRKNQKRILNIVENVYNQVYPSFGWLDSELNSYDASFELLKKGKLPVGNFFVVVGKSMIPKLKMKKLNKSPYPWKELRDGGIIIQSFGYDDYNYLN